MTLNDLVQTSMHVAATASRLQKTALLADALRRFSAVEREIGVGYLVGILRQGRLGVGPALLARLHETPPAADSGLTLGEVDAAFAEVAQMRGAGTASSRRERLMRLYARATAAGQAYLTRLLSGELRQGALDGVLIDAVARATHTAAADVRRAVMLAGDIVAAAAAVLDAGPSALARFRLQLFRPLHPMLAQPATDVDEALARLGRVALEYKLDGARVQLHKGSGRVAVYTRSLHDVSGAVPELIEVAQAIPAQRLILDGEAIALRANGAPQPFQVTMRRFGRKLDVAAQRAQLPLSVFFFDCLHLDGEDLIDHPAQERFTALARVVPSAKRVSRCVTADAGEAGRFLAEALARGHEGVMAKSLDAPYEAGARGSAWLKLKAAHTLDLVVLAAEWGNGRRRGWLSNLHLGARDPGGGFVMLGKTFKGMTDAMLAWQTETLNGLATARCGNVVEVRPELVVEIAFNDLQTSPQYPGGLALRFARVKRYRPDKRADEADTIDTVRAFYARQTGHPATANAVGITAITNEVGGGWPRR